MQLGALFDVNIDANQQMFQYAIEMVNENLLADENFRLEGEAVAIDFGNELNVSQNLCGLLEVCLLHMNLCDCNLFYKFLNYLERSVGSFWSQR